MKKVLSFVAALLLSSNLFASEPVQWGNLTWTTYENIGAWGGTWSGADNRDWMAYDYCWVQYSGLSGAINFGVTYSEWVANHDTWTEFKGSSTGMVDMLNGGGVVGIKLDKTTTYVNGDAETDGQFKGDPYAQHVREIFIQATQGGSSVTIDGIWVGSEAEFQAALVPYQVPMVNLLNENSFVAKEAPSPEILPAVAEDGVIAVTSLAGATNDWDTQFWIVLPGIMPAGTQFKVTFDYMASRNASADTQAHNEPGQYVHWQAIGSPNFTTSWQTYENTVVVANECNGEKHGNDNWLSNFHSIAFNLSKDKANDVTFYFKNIKLEVKEADVTAGILGLPFESGKYYFGNVAAALNGKDSYWGAANSWGTQASLVKHPDYLTLHMQPNGTYTIETRVSNGGESYWFREISQNELFMDQTPATPVKIAKGEIIGYQDDEETIPVYSYYVYNPANGNYYGWNGNNTVLSPDLNAGNPNALWLIATEQEALEGLNEATVQDPSDATFLVADPNFSRNHRGKSAWVGDDFGVGGDNSNTNAEKWGGNSGTFDISQQVEVPNGVYKITWNGFYRYNNTTDNTNDVAIAAHADGTEVINSFIYINGADYPLTSIADVEGSLPFSQAQASAAFGNGQYAQEAYVEVTDGKLTLGIKKVEHPGCDWTVWDNFELTYFGADCTIEEAQNAAVYVELEDLLSEAEYLIYYVDNEGLKAAINNAIEAGENAESLDEVKNAVAGLKLIIDYAHGNVTAQKMLPKMAEVVESTNFYTPAALEEYYTKWQQKYESGWITSAEANALQDPSVITGWHADNTVDDLLMSVWEIGPMNWENYHVNTWSTEGEGDGTNFRVPFIEYWTGDDNALAEKTLTATLIDLPADEYDVTAWARVRLQNGAADPYGITAQVNDGEDVNVADGEEIVPCGNSSFALKEITATGNVADDGVLKFKFKVAADNNISWLSFKNVKYISKTAVGINEVKTNNNDNTIYNLGGQKVKNAQKGIFIKNGKKVVK